MPAFACISLSRRTAMSTATGRLSRAGSLNVRVSWRIANLLAVKYATVTIAESETRTAIPRFMFVLGALTSGNFKCSRLCGLVVQYICHGDVTGRLNIVTGPPYHFAMHPLVVQCTTSRRRGSAPPPDATTQSLVQLFGKNDVKTGGEAVCSKGKALPQAVTTYHNLRR